MGIDVVGQRNRGLCFFVFVALFIVALFIVRSSFRRRGDIDAIEIAASQMQLY